jgi:hypothetical protein
LPAAFSKLRRWRRGCSREWCKRGNRPRARATRVVIWTIRRVELGRWRIELTDRGRTVITLELFDGGGHVESMGLWRISGCVVGIVEAGSG